MDPTNELNEIATVIQEEAHGNGFAALGDLDASLADAFRRRLPQLGDAEIGAVLMILTHALQDADPGLLDTPDLPARGALAALQVAGQRLYHSETANS